MTSGIPIDANFKSLSCQLGGLRLNGIVNYNDPSINGGTAESLTVLTIDDPASAQSIDDLTISGKFLRIKVSNEYYYIPLYH